MINEPVWNGCAGGTGYAMPGVGAMPGMGAGMGAIPDTGGVGGMPGMGAGMGTGYGTQGAYDGQTGFGNYAKVSMHF